MRQNALHYERRDGATEGKGRKTERNGEGKREEEGRERKRGKGKPPNKNYVAYEHYTLILFHSYWVDIFCEAELWTGQPRKTCRTLMD